MNPGFEHGREPWVRMSNGFFGAFDLVEAPVRSGRQAALLRVHWEKGQAGHPVKVFGIVQEHRPESRPDPSRFPEVLSGWFRIDRWEKESPATNLYVQVVAAVSGDPRAARIISPSGGADTPTNYQIRYYLAGQAKPAFTLSNARIQILRKGLPALGEWTHFEIPLKEDFQRLWGTVPTGYEFLRVLFEARWDNKPEGTSVHADVVYDDLFLGFGPNERREHSPGG